MDDGDMALQNHTRDDMPTYRAASKGGGAEFTRGERHEQTRSLMHGTKAAGKTGIYAFGQGSWGS